MDAYNQTRSHHGQTGLGWSLVLLAFAQLITSLDFNIVYVALPELGARLGFTNQSLQWVVSAYALTFGGFLLLGGRAADLLGRRTMFIGALLIYALSSLLGGLATNSTLIIAARALQGMGGALLFPATLSLINTIFEEGTARNRALAVWGGAGASGLTLGSLLGGFLTQSFGWSSVFFVNVPLALIVVLGAIVAIPKDAAGSLSGRFDIAGAVTVTGGVTLLVFSLIQGPSYGWSAPLVLASDVCAALLLLAFIAVESRSREPLMPLRLFANRSLVTAMLITFIFMGTFSALPYFLTVLFQRVMGYDALQTGLAFLVPSLSIALGTQIGERLATKRGTQYTLMIGLIIGAAGTAILGRCIYPGGGYLVLVPGLIVAGIGQGMTWTGMWIAAAAGVDAKEQGVASGMASTSLQVGGAVGLAVLVAIAGSSFDASAEGMSHLGIVEGTRNAIYGAAIGICVALVVALSARRSAE
ncbi:MFS transporter [Rhizobium lusitanum]|uniref:EmrB/QacA subfamily drug resistance transporter n=1 Tax=Rhizobium lusitanum TaxID=293958 RepID=A0A7X0IZN1_9HYPH|nr:MFS transporter [Rhizobium lusitanum]MBB6488671.1 EmrB/QacA subfamily drug resistance transporter [Rhizobium lusitanum]